MASKVREGSAVEQVSIPRKTALQILRRLGRLEEQLRGSNALRSLIPETLIAEAYKAWKNRDKASAPLPVSIKATAKAATTEQAWRDATGPKA